MVARVKHLDSPHQNQYTFEVFRRSSMVEQEAVNFEVAGSSPAAGAKLDTQIVQDQSSRLVFFTSVNF